MAEKIDREQWIEKYMKATGQPRDRAEFAADIEYGVLPKGDLIEVEEDEDE